MKMNPFSYFPIVSSAHVRRAAGVACGLLAGTNSASAAAKTWTGATDGLWAGANWTPSAPAASGDNIIFNNNVNTTITGVTSTSFATATGISFALGAGSFTIGTIGGGATFSFSGGGIANTSGVLQTINTDIDFAATNRTINASAVGSDITLNGTVSGTAGFTKSNAGTLTLNGANTITGTSSLNAGVVGLGNNAALGGNAGIVKLNGASLTANTSARTLNNVIQFTNATTINAGQDLTFGASGSVTNFNGNRTLTVSNTKTTLAGSVYLSDNATSRIFTITGAGNSVISGKISNSNGAGATGGQLNKSGAGTLTLSNGTSDFTGISTVTSGVTANLAMNLSAGTLVIDADSTPSTANATVTSGPLGTGTLLFGSATITAGTTGRTIANQVLITNAATAIVGGSNNMTFNGKLTFLGGTNTFLTSSNSATTTFGGGITIRDDGSTAVRFPTISNTGSGAMIISAPIVNGSSLDGQINIGGTGIVQLNAANTYSSSTTVLTGATAKIGNAAGLGYGGTLQNAAAFSTTVNSGSTVDLNGQTGVNEPLILNGTGVGGNGALINSNIGTPAVIGNGIAGTLPGSPTLSGTGYDNTTMVTIAAPGGGGSTATATASLGLTASSFSISSGTTTYSAAPVATITGGGGVGATATAVLDGGGSVIGVTITNNGKDFTSAPTIAFTGGTVLAAGTNPTGTGNATNFGLKAIAMTGAGSGYTSAPVVTISGTGSGATAAATITTVNLATASSIGGAGDITVNAVVSGNSMTKVGTGTLTLNGTNTYTGATAVSAGRFEVGSTGSINTSSAVTVAAGSKFTFNSSTSLTVGTTLNGAGTGSRAVLGGSGTINTALTLDNLGDTLSPGNSPGAQNFTPNQTWDSFSYDWEVNNFVGSVAGTDFDQIGVTGTLSLTGGSGSYLLNLLSLTGANASGNVGGFSDTDQSWTILTSSGLTGFDAANWTLNSGGFSTSPTYTGSFSLGQVGNDLVLSYTVVPEPAAALLGSLGILTLLRRRRVA